MSFKRDTNATLDRLVRVRRVQAHQAMAALGKAEARRASEVALQQRITGLIATETPTGSSTAMALQARKSGEALLGALAADSAARLAVTLGERQHLAEALARARAAVDAAIARRSQREQDA